MKMTMTRRRNESMTTVTNKMEHLFIYVHIGDRATHFSPVCRSVM